MISASHALSSHELPAPATGEWSAEALEKLRAAELSKHKVLLAAIMRMAARASAADPDGRLPAAYRLLAEIEAGDSAAVRFVLASAQFGAWASDCAAGLWAVGRHQGSASTLASDLARLAVFAATAGFLSGHRFEIEVPLHDGAVSLPGLGTATLGSPTASTWGRARLDERGGCISSPLATVWVAGDRAVDDERWRPSPRLVLNEHGLRLDVELDDRDPFLDRYGAKRPALGGDVGAWQDLLAQAWAALAADHRPLATVIAGTVRTLVPLARPAPTRTVSSTDTTAFGAVALSRPPDPLAMAEALVHESHHAVLGAITDLEPMLTGSPGPLAYAPWRDDPRPVSALLHGVYTHYVMIDFWRRQRGNGPAGQRLRCEVEFGRWRSVTAQAADLLARSDSLTEAGSAFLAPIRANLERWQREPLTSRAAALAADLVTEHRVRWRVRHLVPDPAAIESLAAAFRSGAAVGSVAAVGTVLRPGPLPEVTENARAYLLALRHQDPELLARLLSGETPADWIDDADRLLAAGRSEAAAAGYRARLASGRAPDAWAGLAVATRQAGPPAVARLLSERPEVAAAVCGRLAAAPTDPGPALDWLAGEP